MSEKLETISAQDDRLSWDGAVSVERTDDWVMPWRVPYEDKVLFPPDGLGGHAASPAGVRLRFASDTRDLRLNVEPRPQAGKLDVVCDSEVVETITFAAGDTQITSTGLPEGRKEIELWLPHTQPFRLRSVEISAGATLEKLDDRRPRWITYGSSISHCGAAQSPAYTWPAITARECGFNLTCLGFGGNAHAEPNVARMIRELPADYISLKIGINIMGSGSLNTRTFLPAMLGFVAIIREKHPDTPLVFCSSIYSPPRETTDNAVGLSLTKMRAHVQETVEIFKSRGDNNIYYVDGLKLMGPNEAHLLPDDVHPNAEGYKVLAQNFIREAAKKYFTS